MGREVEDEDEGHGGGFGRRVRGYSALAYHFWVIFTQLCCVWASLTLFSLRPSRSKRSLHCPTARTDSSLCLYNT